MEKQEQMDKPLELAEEHAERKQAEETLRESEEKYRTQFEEALDAIFVGDAETGIIIDCNRAASELVGREKSELVGKHQRILHPPEEIEGEFSRTFKQHLQEKDGQILETQVITKTGEIRDVAIKANVIEVRGRKLIQGIFRDITERKRAEEKLIRLSSAVRRSTDSIVISDLSGKIIDVNEATLEMYGTDDKGDLLGKNSFDLIAVEEREKALIGMKEVLEKGYLKSREYNIVTKDGSRIPVEMSVAIMKDADGKPIGFVGISRDITERKQMERELTYERDLLHALMDNIPDAIYFKDVDSHFTRINRAHAQRIGLKDPREAVGKTVNDFYPEEYARQALVDEQRIVTARQPLIDKIEKIQTKDGQIRWTSITKVPIIDEAGQVTGIVGVSRDITERKKMEENLAHERDLMQALMDNMPDAIYFKDTNSRFTRVNRRVAEWFGLSDPKDAVGKTDFDFYTQELASKFYADEQAIIQSGQPVIAKEEPESHVGVEWVSSTKVPIRDSEGRVTGIVGISRDITELKAMEKKLREYSEHLEEIVQERTRELRAAQERLLRAERLVAIGETAAMVGHDLRNPLQVISNLLYPGKNMVKEIPPRCRKIAVEMGIEELFGNVAKQIEYMNKIVSDLQDYAKPLRPEFVPTSLYQLINETLSVLTIPETVKVSMKIPKDFPNIVVDSSLMKRLFTNLITNALQAMLDGGQLTIRLEQTESTAVISIEDTGVGIPKENLDKLFQPLFTTKPRGTGFGLPVCKRIVEAHKGSITVESQLGRGSTFTVSIPLTTEVSQTG